MKQLPLRGGLPRVLISAFMTAFFVSFLINQVVSPSALAPTVFGRTVGYASLALAAVGFACSTARALRGLPLRDRHIGARMWPMARRARRSIDSAFVVRVAVTALLAALLVSLVVDPSNLDGIGINPATGQRWAPTRFSKVVGYAGVSLALLVFAFLTIDGLENSLRRRRRKRRARGRNARIVTPHRRRDAPSEEGRR